MPPQLVLATRMPQKASKSQAKTNQNGKKYLEYSELSKEDLVGLLKRVHARIKRISESLRETENEIESLRQLLLYGSTQASNSSPSPGARGKAYGGRAGYKGRTGGYGKYKRAGKKPAQAGEKTEEPVGEAGEEEEEVVEEEAKPAEKKSGEAKEGGGS